jgi:hypothetical protein
MPAMLSLHGFEGLGRDTQCRPVKKGLLKPVSMFRVASGYRWVELLWIADKNKLVARKSGRGFFFLCKSVRDTNLAMGSRAFGSVI